MNRRRFVVLTSVGAASVASGWALWRHLRVRGMIVQSRPFAALEQPRSVGRVDLPADLRQFYERNEGVGLESSPDRMVRLCRLSEVARKLWRDLPIVGNELMPGWEDFEAFYIGVSSFLDGIYWVQRAPCCPTGSVLTMGPDVAGPGGTGTQTLEGTLVLASSFSNWLAHLQKYHWFEYGLGPGAIWDLPASDQSELRAYYKNLNPNIRWEPD